MERERPVSAISMRRLKLELISRVKGAAVLERPRREFLIQRTLRKSSVAERVSHYSQTGLRSGADWELNKHQVVLKFSPSRMLADQHPDGIRVNRRLPKEKHAVNPSARLIGGACLLFCLLISFPRLVQSTCFRRLSAEPV